MEISSRPAVNEAQRLWTKYGPLARLLAALEAHKAIETVDLETCAYWRDVMDELEVIVAQEDPLH